ncbi:FAD-dependent monooxygenase [Mycobacterium eburneum]|nr:FAD-dependent monooxygenase [Mycobacterium eburneum]TDH52887.1 FAD-dependent monooxygenase [Mycobacterium eburneum]
MAGAENFDVVVVGSRCSGAAAAAGFARQGRSVLVLDKSAFPSDTLSTHTLFPTGVSELERIGALPRVLGLNPTFNTRMRVDLDHATSNGVRIEERFRPVRGIDYSLSIPRHLLDGEVVAAIRDQGVEVRERATVQSLTWRGGRVNGVQYLDADGHVHKVHAKLVVGADGRRSTVAAAVGSQVPYRMSKNERGAVFRYLTMPLDTEPIIYQWRDGESTAFGFPSTPQGNFLVLFMGALDEVEQARRDPEGYWAAKLAKHPSAAKICAKSTAASPLLGTTDLASYFRASSGPGWVLIGDAGHFKDPSIGQGMRDAMWGGRTMAEAAGSVLDDPVELDLALRRWEAERDAECLPVYFFATGESFLRPTSPVFAAVLRASSGGGDDPFFSDVAQRVRTPQEVITFRRAIAGLVNGLRQPGRGEFLREVIAEATVQARVFRAVKRASFRPSRIVPGAEGPNATWETTAA